MIFNLISLALMKLGLRPTPKPAAEPEQPAQTPKTRGWDLLIPFSKSEVIECLAKEAQVQGRLPETASIEGCQLVVDVDLYAQKTNGFELRIRLKKAAS